MNVPFLNISTHICYVKRAAIAPDCVFAGGFVRMFQNTKLCVIVPAYNEEQLIADTLASIPANVDKIYVVNDASTDRTQSIIEEHVNIDPRIVPISHTQNRGVGAAIITGYKQGLIDQMQVFVVMAGDNQMDPEVMPSLVTPIIQDRADYTKGNRLLSPEYRKGMSQWRFVGNSILTFLTKFSSGYWNLMDPQNGYTAISRQALGRLNLDTIYPRYGYCNDMLVKLNVFGFRIMDVEMPARYGREQSKIKYGSYIRKVSWLLFKDFLYRLRMKYVVLSFHPIVLFYFFGSILTFAGLLAGFYTIFFVLIQHGPLFIRGVLSLMIFALGMQFLSFALMFDIQENREISLADWSK
jgi:glycosyltransferase involved in cell wall biosynthesis